MPTIDHVIYIPSVLLAGIALGFFAGVRLARAELAKREQQRRE